MRAHPARSARLRTAVVGGGWTAARLVLAVILTIGLFIAPHEAGPQPPAKVPGSAGSASPRARRRSRISSRPSRKAAARARLRGGSDHRHRVPVRGREARAAPRSRGRARRSQGGHHRGAESSRGPGREASDHATESPSSCWPLSIRWGRALSPASPGRAGTSPGWPSLPAPDRRQVPGAAQAGCPQGLPGGGPPESRESRHRTNVEGSGRGRPEVGSAAPGAGRAGSPRAGPRLRRDDQGTGWRAPRPGGH